MRFHQRCRPRGGHFRTLLVIDDEPAVREALSHSADRLGWISASTRCRTSRRQKSLSRQLLQRPNVDAAIIDLDLPLRRPPRIYRLLKQSATEPAPIVVLHAACRSSQPSQARLRTLGVNNEDVFLKQDTSKDLLSMINRFERAWSASVAPTTGGAVA